MNVRVSECAAGGALKGLGRGRVESAAPTTVTMISAHKSQNYQSLNNILDESHDLVVEEEVGGGRDEDLKSVGGYY